MSPKESVTIFLPACSGLKCIYVCVSDNAVAKDLSDVIVELMMVDVLPLCYSSLPSSKENHDFSHFLSSKFTLKLVKSTLGESIIRDWVKWFVRQMKSEVAVINLLQYVRHSLLEVAGEDFTATGPDDTSWDQSFIGKPLHLLRITKSKLIT